MKKIILVLVMIFLAGCASNSELTSALAEIKDLESQITKKDNEITDLKYEVETLKLSEASLQSDYDELKTNGNGEEVQLTSFICPDPIENMKYQNPISAIAILEGWFAVQPHVQEMQGTYSTTFWNDVHSRIHTIRYLSAEDGTSTTDSFLLMFSEAGWEEGLLWMTKQCWLDYPY